MIRNILLSATTSPIPHERNESLQMLNNQLALRTGPFMDQIFTLMCSQDRTDHIISYSYLRKILRESQRGRLIDLNSHMEKAFFFWYEKQRNRNSFEEMYSFQKQNIVQLNALYLSLTTSGRYRQGFIDIVPFKICQLYTKENKYQLYKYLTYYGQVLKQLVKYRIGNINSKKAAMGSVMLLKVTTKLTPENSFEASLWVNFSINFSKFNSWIPDKNFLIKCLIQYTITKESLMTLLEYLSTNFKIVWILQDYCKILQGIEKIMAHCETHVKEYTCKEVQTILKCMRSFSHSFFSCDKKIQNTGDAIIAQYIYSYQQFEKTSLFLINMIQHFSFNNEQQSIGSLSQLIVEYSTQILRLYSTYLEEDLIEKYAKTFMHNFQNNLHHEKLFVFFSSLPKFVLQIFDYQQGVAQILNGTIQLSEKYQPVYVNFLTHYVTVNNYLDVDVLEKLALFFFNLIQSRAQKIHQFDPFSQNQSMEDHVSIAIERVSLSIYALSKLSKYKSFVESNSGYFQTVLNSIFQIMPKSLNEFSVLVDSIGQLINQMRPEWNQVICQKALRYIVEIESNNFKDKRLIFYQVQIQLYRVIKKTVSLTMILGLNQPQWGKDSPNLKLEKASSQDDLQLLIQVCNLDQKSEAVKEEILFLVQEVLFQYHRIMLLGNVSIKEPLLASFIERFITNSIFEDLYRILQDTILNLNENIVQNNMFEKTNIGNEEYAVVGSGFSRELHITCVKILLELCLNQKNLQTIFTIIHKVHSKQLLCVWQAIEIIYPGKIDSNLIPQQVKQRLEKIQSGHIAELLQKMGLNEQKIRMKQTPSWYELYRNILRQDSAAIKIIDIKFQQNFEI